MKHLKTSCQKHKIDSHLLSSRCMTNYMKSVHFYMLISLNKCKWLRICLKKLMVKNSFLEKTCVVGTHSNCLIEAIPMCTYHTYVTEIKEENYLEIYVFQVYCPLSLHLLNIPNCQSVLKFLSLYCKLFIFA